MDQSQDVQMCGSDNKMNDDYGKGKRKEIKEALFTPRQPERWQGQCWESLAQSGAPGEDLPVTGMAELQGTGPQTGLQLEPYLLVSPVQWEQ